MAPFKTAVMNSIWRDAAKKRSLTRNVQATTTLATTKATPQEEAESAIRILNSKVARLNAERDKLLSEKRRHCQQMAAVPSEKAQLRIHAIELDDRLAEAKSSLALSNDRYATIQHKFNVMKKRHLSDKDTATMLDLQRVRRIAQLEKQVARAEDVAIRRRREVDIGNLREQIEEHIEQSSGKLPGCALENRAVLTLFSQLLKEQYKRENLEDKLFSAQDQIKNYQWREAAAARQRSSTEDNTSKQENADENPQNSI